jgi:hypothetical protein
MPGLTANNDGNGAAPTAPGSAGDTSSTSAASPSLPAPSATVTGTGLTTGDLAAVSDPNAAIAAASMVTDPTQLPTVYQIAQFSGIDPSS